MKKQEPYNEPAISPKRKIKRRYNRAQLEQRARQGVSKANPINRSNSTDNRIQHVYECIFNYFNNHLCDGKIYTMIKLDYIKIKNTNQVIVKPTHRGGYTLIINGIPYSDGKSTHERDWTLFDFPEITKIESLGNKTFSEERSKFVLKNPELVSESIPYELSYAEVGEVHREYSCDFPYEWENYDDIRPLYKEIREYDDPEITELEFELNLVSEVDELPRYEDFKFHGGKGRYSTYSGNHSSITITANNVLYYLINKIAVPDILHGHTPCQLSKKDSYLIVREWIKSHINSTYAQLTSDYDFTLTVAKVLPNVVREEYQVDVKTSRQRKPRFETRYRNNHLIENFFNLGDGSDRYNKNTVRFEGGNLQELHDNIQAYLDDLMNQINSPIGICQTCNGNGTSDMTKYEQESFEGVKQ